MKSLISFIALIGLATCITFGSQDSTLDPGRILWPKDKWVNNPIELSQTNAGSTVTLTYNFRPSTTLAAASVDLIFPSSFSSTTMVTLSGTSNLKSGEDTSATYSVTLPSSSGVYGPFGIVTRYSSTGQIVDANYNFGCVAVTSSVSAGSLSVSRLSSGTVTTINTDNTLEFQFTLTFSLWAHDIIEIVPDTTSNLWTLKTGPTCKSVGDSNILIGPDSTNTSDLPCSLGKKSSSSSGVATAADTTVSQDSIYIYGLSSDAYISSGSTSNSYVAKIDVSSITSPPSVTSSSSWIVNIWRFGTNNLIAKYTTSSGPASTAGTASFSSWTGVNFPSNTVVVGQTLFTKLTVSTSNPLPASSSLVVTFSGANNYDTVWWQDTDGTGASSGNCYVTSPTDGVSCTVSDATTLSLSFSKAQAKGSFSVVLLSYFSSSTVQVSKITSYYGAYTSTAVVDQSASNPGTFTIKSNASPNYLLSDLGLNSLATTTTYPILTLANGAAPATLDSSDHQYGGDQSADIFIRIRPGSSNQWGGAAPTGLATTVVLYFPRASTFEFANFGSVYIDGTPTKSEYISALSTSTTATDLSSAGTTNAITVGTSTTNQISLGFSSSTDSLDSSASYVLRYHGTNKQSLPFIVSNLGTFYEIWAIATYTASVSTIETGSAVFSVLSQDASASLFTVPACAADLDGIPLVVYFAPINVDFDFSAQSYAIDIEIDVGYSSTDGFMATGIMATSNAGTLTYGTQFTSTASTTPTATFTTSSSKLTITLKNLGSTTVSPATSVYAYLPAASHTLGEATLSISTYFYFTKSPDTSIRQVIYHNEGHSQTIGTGNTNTYDATASTGATSPASWDIGTSATVVITQGLQAATTHDVGTDTYVGVGLPAGYTFSSPVISSKIASATTFTNAPAQYYIASQDETHAGGFIFGTKTSSTAWGAGASDTTAVTYNLQITNLSPPNYSGTDAINTWIADTTDLGGACVYSKSYTSNSISQLKLTTPTCTSNSGALIGLSADSVSLTMTFGFTTTVAVLKGGSVKFTMDSSWTWPSTSSSYSTSIKGTITTGSVLTIALTDTLSAGSYTVTVTGVTPPTNSGSTDLDKDCYTDLTTYASTGDSVENWATTDEADLQTTIGTSTSVVTGVSSSFTVTAYPNAPDKVTDLLLAFNLNKKVPAGGYIQIKTPSSLTWSYDTATASIKNKCWTSFVYSRCEIASSTTINIYPTADLSTNTAVNVYLDGAITFSAAGASGYFLISAYWGSTTIVDDSLVTSGGAQLTVGAAVTNALTLTVAPDITTAGEKSNYLFSFSSASAVSSGDMIFIQFPRDYDAYLGDADNTYTGCQATTWYLSCNSTTLGTGITCMADHWYLIVSGASAQSANAALTLTVNGIRNPTSSSATGYFNIWHYDSKMNVKAWLYSTSAQVTPTAPVNNIVLKPIAATDRTFTTSTSYMFDFYPVTSTTTFTSANTFSIVFPQQFNVKLYTTSTVTCSSTTYDETSATSPTGTSWVGTSSCNVNGNTITFTIPSGSTPSVKSTDRIRITLSNVNNPQYGLTRTTGWDVTTTNYGSSYAYWTNRFDLIVSDSTNKVLNGRTYGVLNSGYLGFNYGSSAAINVNSYVASNKNSHIQIIAGQQSADIPISLVSGANNVGLKSQKLVLTPRTNTNYPDAGNNIQVTSVHHDKTAFQFVNSINFRVSAKTGTSTGIYYLDWTTAETRQDGVGKDIYSAPLSTLVEVCAASGSASISVTVDTLPTLYPGYTSIPISVTLGYAPATKLTVTPSFGTTATGITINPTVLTFLPDTQTMYFELTVDKSYSTTQSPKLSFTLGEVDAGIFIAPSAQSPTVTATVPTSSTSFTLTAGTTTQTSVTITAKFSQEAVIYWGLSCSGVTTLSYSDLVAKVQPLVNPSSNTTSLAQKLAADYQATETHIDYTLDTDITSFFRRMNLEHCSDMWTSAVVNRAKNGQSTITLDWLMDGTKYTIFAYADNKISSTPVLQTASFTTQASNLVYSTSVSFAADVAATFDDTIRRALAKNMGVNPDWLISTGRTTTTSGTRFLQTTTTAKFSYNVVYDRSKPAYSPSFILAQLDQTGASSDLKDATGGTSPSDFGAATALSTGTVPSFTSGPANSTVTDTTATFTAVSSQNGLVCVSCTDPTVTGITYAWQVVAGLDSEAMEAHGKCANATTENTNSVTLEVTGLTQDTSYVCYFTTCNTYPTNTYCLDASTSGSSTTALPSIKITTESVDDAAIYLSLLTAFFLIFN